LVRAVVLIGGSQAGHLETLQVDLTTVEQLVVYFAGHGVNLSLTEYWLLSGVPEDSNAAR
jgi:hypothetical protein